jgi:hypothetical protein
MGMIVLQFSTSTAWQSSIIRKMCHSPFSHVDVCVATGALGASDTPTKVLLGNPHGVAIREHDYQDFGIRRRAIIDSEKSGDFHDIMRSQLGKPFDPEALHDFLSDNPRERDWRNPEKWFCSELVAWSLERAGFFPYKLLVPKNRVSPADLLLLLNPYIDTENFWNPVPDLKLGRKER